MISRSGDPIFIINPDAAGTLALGGWPHIELLARKSIGRFKAFFTSCPRDASIISRSAFLDGATTVVCVGGDGTFNEAVNGFMEKDGSPLNPDAALAVIPRGTGCDFARGLPAPVNIKRALAAIKRRRVRYIDLGRVRYTDHSGKTTFSYFHNVTSFGMGGEVVRRANRTPKILGGFTSFIWATLTSMFLYNSKCIRLKVDNSFDKEIVSLNVAVANGQYHGGGMRVAPGAVMDDGLFHITIVGDINLSEFLLNLPRLYNGNIGRVKKVKIITGIKVEAYSDQKVLLEMDGEQPGRLPAVFEIIPKVLPVVIE